MRVEQQTQGRDAVRVIAGMITDDAVCGRAVARWQSPGLFGSPVENRVAGWCVKYYLKYGKAPGSAIQAIYETQVQNDRIGKDESPLIEKLLIYANEEHNQNGNRLSSDYLVDLMANVVNRVKISGETDEIRMLLAQGKVDEAEAIFTGHTRIELGMGSVFKPGEDLDGWISAFDDEQSKPLITYPGQLGEFFGGELARDSFVAFTGTAKRGKSFWLLDMSYRAARQRCKVAYFEAGDMSERQVKRRMAQRAMRKPRVESVVKIPVRWPDDSPPKFEDRKLKPPTPQGVMREWAKIQRGQDAFRLSCHANGSLTIADIDNHLKSWARDGWVADCIFIDYADILAQPAGVRDLRDGTNQNWMGLRRLSQELHCLVVTATQSDAASYDAKVIRRKNFSDDRRKHDHVTAMLGINVSDDDKQLGIARLNWIDRRDAEFSEGKQIYVAGCLAVACPAILSKY